MPLRFARRTVSLRWPRRWRVGDTRSRYSVDGEGGWMGSLVAGVDCSTQSTKVLIVDPDDGRVVATGRADHVVTGVGGARETDPEAWWSALGTSLAQTQCVQEIAAIAVGGQQHGLVVQDRMGRPLRPAMLWNDTRS